MYNKKMILGVLLLLIDVLLFSVFFLGINVVAKILFLLFSVFNLYYLYVSKFWSGNYGSNKADCLSTINIVGVLIVYVYFFYNYFNDLMRTYSGSNVEEKITTSIFLLIPILNIIYSHQQKKLK